MGSLSHPARSGVAGAWAACLRGWRQLRTACTASQEAHADVLAFAGGGEDLVAAMGRGRCF